MTSRRGDRLEAIVSPIVRAVKGSENITRLEKQMQRLHRTTRATNRELRTLNRLQRGIVQSPPIQQVRGGFLQRIPNNRYIRSPHTQVSNIQPLSAIESRRRAQDVTTAGLGQIRQAHERRIYRQSAQRASDAAMRQHTRALNRFSTFGTTQENLQVLNQQTRRAHGNVTPAAVHRQRRMAHAQWVQDNRDFASQWADSMNMAEESARNARRELEHSRKITTRIERTFAKMRFRKPKPLLTPEEQFMVGLENIGKRQRAEKLYKTTLTQNNQLLREAGVFGRRNWRYRARQNQLAKQTIELLKSSLPLHRKINLLARTTASGAFGIKSAFRALPPNLQIALVLSIALVATWALIGAGIFAAVRAVQQFVAEAARAGTTVASIYRSMAAGTAIGLPMREASQLIGGLTAETAGNLSAVANDVKTIDKINQTLASIGSEYKFTELLNMPREQLERALVGELLRLEKDIKNSGRRVAAQILLLEGVAGLSQVGDESFPLVSAFRRGEGSHLLRAWQRAQPLDEATYNQAARLAGMFERAGIALINVGAALGSALSPLATPFLERLITRIENLGIWFQNNPDVLRRWFKGLMLFARPFIILLDVIILALGTILFLLNAIVWFVGMLSEKIPGLEAATKPHTLTGAVISALPAFETQRPLDDFQGTTSDANTLGSSVVNNYYTVYSEDEIIVQGAESPQASAEAISERDRVQFSMHGVR